MQEHLVIRPNGSSPPQCFLRHLPRDWSIEGSIFCNPSFPRDVRAGYETSLKDARPSVFPTELQKPIAFVRTDQRAARAS